MASHFPIDDQVQFVFGYYDKIYRRDIALCAQFPYIDLVCDNGEVPDRYDSYNRKSISFAFGAIILSGLMCRAL